MDTETTDSDEQPDDYQNEATAAVSAETSEGIAFDAETHESGEQLKDAQEDAAENKVLKRDEFDLLKSGDDTINKRLDAQTDDYRDKGMSDAEIQDKLAADKWNFQKEFLEDTLPGQDVSLNVFNGFSENGAKDRIGELSESESLADILRNNSSNESQYAADVTNEMVDGDASNDESYSSETGAAGEETEGVTTDAKDIEFDEQVTEHQDELADDVSAAITENIADTKDAESSEQAVDTQLELADDNATDKNQDITADGAKGTDTSDDAESAYNRLVSASLFIWCAWMAAARENTAGRSIGKREQSRQHVQ